MREGSDVLPQSLCWVQTRKESDQRVCVACVQHPHTQEGGSGLWGWTDGWMAEEVRGQIGRKECSFEESVGTSIL